MASSRPSSFSDLVALETLPSSPGTARFRARICPESCNSQGVAAGGMLAAIATQALCASFADVEGARPVHLTLDFPAGARAGDVLEVRVDRTRTGKAASFARFEIARGDEILAYGGSAFTSSIFIASHPLGRRSAPPHLLLPPSPGVPSTPPPLRPSGYAHLLLSRVPSEDPWTGRVPGEMSGETYYSFPGEPASWALLAFLCDVGPSNKASRAGYGDQLKKGFRPGPSLSITIDFFDLPDPAEGGWIRSRTCRNVENGPFAGIEQTLWSLAGGLPLAIGRASSVTLYRDPGKDGAGRRM
ncbi:thioesterase-like superfamily-domain-containing protein [Hyaloraphidium curvatum]|nr:thioesterase-like superfamily-domain-containing protein [Hyaloraphidium curvatum]